jgi:hypothetical protein
MAVVAVVAVVVEASVEPSALVPTAWTSAFVQPPASTRAATTATRVRAVLLLLTPRGLSRPVHP